MAIEQLRSNASLAAFSTIIVGLVIQTVIFAYHFGRISADVDEIKNQLTTIRQGYSTTAQFQQLEGRVDRVQTAVTDLQRSHMAQIRR